MPDPKDLQKTALRITRAVGSPLSIIIHTLLFIASFLAVTADFIDFDRMLLILTTVVSLEAIYLAIFIQMTINYQGESIRVVQEDVGEIQEDVEELQEDVEEISEDVGEISEDVEEMTEEDAAEEAEDDKQEKAIAAIHSDLQRLLVDIEKLKNTKQQ